MNLRRAATTALAIVVALTLAMGRRRPQIMRRRERLPATRCCLPLLERQRRAPGMWISSPDERMVEEELELAEAAPHTLWRFDAGSA